MANRTKVILETFGVFVGLVGFTIVGYAVFVDFQSSWEFQSYNEGPLELKEWPPKLALVFGIWLFVVRLAVDLVRSSIGIYTGEALATRSEEDRALETEI